MGEYIYKGKRTEIKDLLIEHNYDINAIKSDLECADRYCRNKNGIEALCEHFIEITHE